MKPRRNSQGVEIKDGIPLEEREELDLAYS